MSVPPPPGPVLTPAQEEVRRQATSDAAVREVATCLALVTRVAVVDRDVLDPAVAAVQLKTTFRPEVRTHLRGDVIQAHIEGLRLDRDVVVAVAGLSLTRSVRELRALHQRDPEWMPLFAVVEPVLERLQAAGYVSLALTSRKRESVTDRRAAQNRRPIERMRSL